MSSFIWSCMVIAFKGALGGLFWFISISLIGLVIGLIGLLIGELKKMS